MRSAAGYEAPRPSPDVICGCELVSLGVVAGPVGQDEVLETVVGMPRPGKEVVHLGRDRLLPTVEAGVVLDVAQLRQQDGGRDTGCSEEELLEAGLLETERFQRATSRVHSRWMREGAEGARDEAGRHRLLA